MSEKTLSLLERRQLEQAVSALAAINNESALVNAARAIVHTYPASQVLTLLVKNLDTPSSQLRGGLAHLAVLLPPEETVPVLRHYAASRQNPPPGRFTAATILERYLGENISPGMLTDLQSNDDAAFQSLKDAVDESKQNRYILFEYVTQMREHDEGVAFAVMEALQRLLAEDRVELLRLIAQDERDVVAQAALMQLDQLAASGENRQAIRALATLGHVLPTKGAEPIERSLRKLRMRGKGYQPPASDGWRALISPADPAGNQSLWLLSRHTEPEATDNPGTLISCIVNLQTGMLAFYCSEQVDPAILPAFVKEQALVKVQTETGDSTFLEVPALYGMWLAQTALQRNHNGEGAVLLPGDYQLYNDLIWQFEPRLDEAILRLLTKSPAAAQTQDEPAKIDPDELESDAELLLAHPSMAVWAFHGLPGGNEPATVFGQKLSKSQLATVILREISLVPERVQLLTAIEGGLRLQSVWLHLAGETDLAMRAQRLAQALPLLSMTENPLLRRMVERGLKDG